VTPEFEALVTQIEAQKLAVAIRFREQEIRMARELALLAAAAWSAEGACRSCGMDDEPLDGGGLCRWCAEAMDLRCAALMAEAERDLAAEDRQMSWAAAWAFAVAFGVAFYGLLAVLLNVLPR
jgi:hypothetical protein